MKDLLELLANGVSTGLLYALITLGFVVIFKATRVVNFAYPSFMLLGVYLVAVAAPRTGFAAAVLIGLAATALLSLAAERLLVARVRPGDHHGMAILTIGLNIIVLAELGRRIEERVLPLGAPWDGHVVRVGGMVFPLTVVLTVVAVPLLIGAMAVLLRVTGMGLAVRASVEDAEGATLSGVRLTRVSAGAWAAAGLLATVAGIGLASFPSPGVSLSMETVALTAFPAAIIGGLDSLGGAVVGGLVVGMVQVLAAGYQEQLSFLGLGLGDVGAYVVMLAVLLWRPSGLFGAKEVGRV